MPQYQGVWTLPVAARLQSNQQWVTDPLYRNTTLLLQADNAANGAQNNTFLDSSTNNFTITRNGNTTQGSFSPFSQTGWSNFFNGTGNYLTIGTSTNLALGSGDFTIETWLYVTALNASTSAVFEWRTAGGAPTDIPTLFLSATNIPVFYASVPSGALIIGSSAIPLNTWAHLAVVRNGSGSNNVTMYLNGINIGAGTNTSNLGIQTLRINDPQGAYGTTGYFSNARIVKGTAVYTSNFTPPATPLTAITNAQLLTCQSNRFVDNSTNNFTITPTGTPSVQAFSPFAPQYQYTPSVTGGSGYFDGTGDYLTTSGTNSAWALGTGDFQISFWLYPQSVSGFRDVFTQQNIGGTPQIFLVNNALRYNNAGIAAILDATTSIKVNEWVYCVLSRVSGTTRWFINGAAAGSVSDTNNWSNTNGWYVSTNAQPYQGYIADVRLVKGSGVTSSTVPTAPDTAITNTQFLVGFTNAGIYDGTLKNNLETVGNAQVNTSIVKYGTGSMAFDGSGDYLVVGNMATTPNLALGSGDFTIEYWYYPLNTNIHASLNNLDDSAGTGSLWILMNGTFSGGSKVQFGYNTGSISNILFGTGTFATNQWYHIAITRQGSAMRCFINGVQEGATNTGIGSGSIQSFNRNLVIGATLSSGTYSVYNLNGYLDDFRITKGVARYTANFTPPTVALPRQ